MRTAPIVDLRAHFRTYLNECRDAPVVVTKNGHPIAVLLGVSGDEDLVRILQSHEPTTGRGQDARAAPPEAQTPA
jgi:prevent-host-death family protein